MLVKDRAATDFAVSVAFCTVILCVVRARADTVSYTADFLEGTVGFEAEEVIFTTSLLQYLM